MKLLTIIINIHFLFLFILGSASIAAAIVSYNYPNTLLLGMKLGHPAQGFIQGVLFLFIAIGGYFGIKKYG